MLNNCEPMVVLEFYCLFFRTSWGVGVLNSAIFNSFHIELSLARFWRAFGISEGGGGFEPPKLPPRYATDARRRFVQTFASYSIYVGHVSSPVTSAFGTMKVSVSGFSPICPFRRAAKYSVVVKVSDLPQFDIPSSTAIKNQEKDS